MSQIDLERCVELMRSRDLWQQNTIEYNQKNLYALADEVPGLVAAVRELRELLAAANEREQIQLRCAVEAIKERNELRALREIFVRRWPLVVAEFEKPTPMCRPDPLGDVFPAGEGSPT